MHYTINGKVVKSERTAKPRVQASRPLKKWLLREESRGDVLDFGCGRLRYAPELAAVAKTLTFVDSNPQLQRICSFSDQRETVSAQAARHWPKARVLEYRDFVNDSQQYDFILCANVLSAIPVDRERRAVVTLLGDRLKPSGQCLFVTQYRNSYYRQLALQSNTSRHLDGVLVDRGPTLTFFGLLSRESLTQLTRECGLQTLAAWIKGQSAYVLCACAKSVGSKYGQQKV